MALGLRRGWKLWKPARRRKRYWALAFHARELMLAPLRLRPEWPQRRMARLAGSPPAQGSRLVAFVGCDPHYLHDHVGDLVRSIERSSPDTAVHLHVYHPSKRDHAAIDALRRGLRLPLSATWEDCRLDGMTRGQRITYYEATRFVRFAEVVEQAPCPMVSIDADSLVRAPLTRVLDATTGADVGLVLRGELGDSGLNVLAAAALARPTAAARLYFGEVARRIARHLVSKPEAKFVDQRCMWFAYRKLRKRVRFAQIPTGFSDASMTDGSPIWHAKGERSEHDARYRQARVDVRSS